MARIRKRDSLRFRLTLIFVGLAVGPLLLISVIVSQLVYAGLEQQSVILEHEVATGIGNQVRGFIQQRENELYWLDQVYGLGVRDRGAQRAMLGNLLLTQRVYQELALIDLQGQEQLRLSLSDTFVDGDFDIRTVDPSFWHPATYNETYFGPVRFDEVIREPLMTLSVAINDLRSGKPVAVLVADLRFRPVWDLLAKADLSGQSDVYVTDSKGRVVAHRNPGVVLRGTIIDLEAGEGRAVGLSGTEVIIGRDTLRFNDQELVVIAEQPYSSAVALAARASQVGAVVTAVALVLAIILVVFAVRQVVRPVEALAASARAISNGDFGQSVYTTSKDEVGELAEAFDEMRRQLQRSLTDLEQENITRERAQRQLQRTLAELARSNAELEQFAYVASHDLQEPLRKVRVFGDRLWAHQADAFSDRGRDYLARMQDAARRMQVMIEDLLVFSRITTQARLFAPVDLVHEAHGVVSDLQVRIEETQGVVEIGDLPTIDADVTQMRQLLSNLIGNGIKFHRQGVPPLVQVTGRVLDHDGGASCQIHVRDNGIGFDVKYLDRIFQPFQRLHGRGEYRGTGIGLAICRKVVERHSGSITAQSQPGQGTTFIVTLPVHQKEKEIS